MMLKTFEKAEKTISQALQVERERDREKETYPEIQIYRDGQIDFDRVIRTADETKDL